MKKVIISSLLFLSFAILFSNSISAQGKRVYGFGFDNDSRHCFFAENINLTDEQKQTINDLRYQHQSKAIELRSKLAQNQLELKKLFDEDNVDENAVMNIVNENNNIRNLLTNSKMEIRLKINSLLTSEQKQELKNKSCCGFGFGQEFKKGERNHKSYRRN